MRLASAQGKWLLAAMILGSGMAFLDGSIVGLALPAMGRDLDAGVTGLQWTVNAYTLTLAALILVGGSLGDRLGRRRVYVVGVAWFALASVMCAIAPTIEVLVAARGLQGIGAALLTPGSLAIISASFVEEDRGKAIGAWSGLAGVTTAIGPLAGGWMVDAIGWRSIFWLNVPLAAVVIWLSVRHVPETRGEQGKLDLTGAALAAGGLALLTYGLSEKSWMWAIAGIASMIVFVIHQKVTPHALVPLSLFADRVFTAANICTFAIYGALSGSMFLLVLQLQYVSGYKPLEAGLATIAITILMLLFSSKAGELGAKIGPRWPMTIGPIVAAAGLLLLLGVGEDPNFWVDVLPGSIVFGAGITLLVAPLTTAVLAAAPTEQTGIASGINNAVARTASLLAVAAIPPIAGIAGANFSDPDVFGPGYRTGMWICAGMLVVAGICAMTLIRGNKVSPKALQTDT
ncbi:EmrB/QacA subfamily drug resistance transporter [Aeromicrobium panaciterrae]|uniref:EmrB/QacA subfamily drug resistance transporter n=1 Tax=Aeromicrobium panaciterrae TaxID=363861 RepID=A0ABU1UR32_9ACTN|nr:MFS transporter [Aeromicrobium panaciterrae]MDR7087590.1 EmrB/QacA subfamily drug resistance transporter [Aeromicrobium panaciterrae]